MQRGVQACLENGRRAELKKHASNAAMYLEPKVEKQARISPRSHTSLLNSADKNYLLIIT